MARNTNRDGSARSNLCLICVNEQVKASQRRARIRKFITEIEGWPDAKIASEIDWLEQKLIALALEQGQRKSKLKAR